MSIPAAGAAYFAIVFAAGFLLGALRTLIAAPVVGEVTAVVVEAPFMTVIAWFACGWVLNKIRVPRTSAARAAMGAVALGLLLVAEALLALPLRGLSLHDYLRSYNQAGPLIGLSAQLLCALFPLLQARSRKGQGST